MFYKIIVGNNGRIKNVHVNYGGVNLLYGMAVKGRTILIDIQFRVGRYTLDAELSDTGGYIIFYFIIPIGPTRCFEYQMDVNGSTELD